MVTPFVCLGALLVAVCLGDNSILTPMEDNQLLLDVSCCHAGLKSMGNIDVCVAPCCYGYTEQVAETPQLGLISWCEKTQESVKRRRNSTRGRGNLLQKLLGKNSWKSEDEPVTAD